MKKSIRIINSVSELHRLLALPKPTHPLITLIDHALEISNNDVDENIVLNFYNITIKRSFQGTMKYGKNYYDFDEGTMSFIAPKQLLTLDQENERNKDGWSLLFHPDLIREHPLGRAIKDYNFFSYEANEALHLSDTEEQIIESLVRNIEREIKSAPDHYNSSIIISGLELLLAYCNRYYNRQFLTRKMASSDLLSRFEAVLAEYSQNSSKSGLPTVTKLAETLHLSPGYLSDMLRAVTGQNAQQHIHNHLIEKAKDLLASTGHSVAEIAFQLGFEYPQSFNKLFKSKAGLSPLQYRQSFN
jgi:AraC family transcriptional regulator, transcriptional activator of pobA